MNVIQQCYWELFGQHGLALFDIDSVKHAPSSSKKVLQQCHYVEVQCSQDHSGNNQSSRPTCMPGATMKLVPTTCLQRCFVSGQTKTETFWDPQLWTTCWAVDIFCSSWRIQGHGLCPCCKCRDYWCYALSPHSLRYPELSNNCESASRYYRGETGDSFFPNCHQFSARKDWCCQFVNAVIPGSEWAKMPCIEPSIVTLPGACWFPIMDLASGYNQVPVTEADKMKTAFCTPFSLLEWNRMPLGLCNTPSAFQQCLDLNMVIHCCYIWTMSLYILPL